MDVRNCRKCGRLFNYVVGPIMCPSCRESMEKIFQEVKKYVYEHKGITIIELSEACNIEKHQIQQWLREERLVLSQESPIGIDCEKCGCMIKGGRFCQQCKNEIANNLNSVLPKKDLKTGKREDQRDNARMRYLER